MHTSRSVMMRISGPRSIAVLSIRLPAREHGLIVRQPDERMLGTGVIGVMVRDLVYLDGANEEEAAGAHDPLHGLALTGRDGLECVEPLDVEARVPKRIVLVAVTQHGEVWIPHLVTHLLDVLAVHGPPLGEIDHRAK